MSFAKDAKDVIVHAAKTGKIKATSEVIHNRREICKLCPHLRRTHCGKCGCLITSKTMFVAAKCPDRRW